MTASETPLKPEPDGRIGQEQFLVGCARRLMRDLDLPRSEGRQLVLVRDRTHELDGEDSAR